jgi:hypothetical protein
MAADMKKKTLNASDGCGHKKKNLNASDGCGHDPKALAKEACSPRCSRGGSRRLGGSFGADWCDKFTTTAHTN